jgi:hypothetical protein
MPERAPHSRQTVPELLAGSRLATPETDAQVDAEPVPPRPEPKRAALPVQRRALEPRLV